MINWEKLQPIYERKAYRIVQRHIKTILYNIPVNNVSIGTYKYLIEANITQEQVYKMFKELYETIGLNYGNRINKDLDKVQKQNNLFNEYLLQQILLFLSNDGGVKITSVRDTLVADVIKSIEDSLKENATVIDIQNAIYEIVRQRSTFYKWQALRIARTETTSASGFAAMKTAESSNLVMVKQWISVLDKRTRLDHYSENGQRVELDDPFIMTSGQSLNYPGDSKASPSQVINCRCTVAFIPKRDADGMLILKTNV